MRLAYKVLLVTLSLSLLIPLSGAVAYLPIAASNASATLNPISDMLAGSIAILGTMALGKILQWILRLGQKTKKGVVSGIK